MRIKQKKGISLIVLAITIIVMIILAAAIILSINSSGIIGKANEAKEKTDILSAKEIVAMANGEWLLMSISEQAENGGTFINYAEDKLNEAGYNIAEYVISEEGTVEKCVAMIGEQKFIDLSDAIYSIEDNTETTITIVDDIEISSTISISRSRNIIVDLNGYTVSGVGIAVFTNGGTLTVKDTSDKNTGILQSKPDSNKHAKYTTTFDYDNDGYITKKDANTIVRHTSGIETVTDEALLARFDVNGDNVIDAEDARVLAAEYCSIDCAIYNYISLVIDETMEGKIFGKPEAISE